MIPDLIPANTVLPVLAICCISSAAATASPDSQTRYIEQESCRTNVEVAPMMYLKDISGGSPSVNINPLSVGFLSASSDWTISGWVRPVYDPSDADASRNVFSHAGVAQIRIGSPQRTVEARVRTGPGTWLTIGPTAADTYADGAWLFIALVHDADEQSMTLFAFSQSQPSGVATTASASQFDPITTGTIFVGTEMTGVDAGYFGTTAGMTGDLGVWSARPGAVEQSDVQSIFAEKRWFGLMTYEGSGFTAMDTNQLFAINHGVAQMPIGVGVSAQNGSRLGSYIVSGNYTVLLRDGTAVNENATREVRPISVIGEPVFSNVVEDFPGLFLTETAAVPYGITGRSTIARRLGRDEPIGLERIFNWSNSRAVRQSFWPASPTQPEDPFNYPGNHTTGFGAARHESFAGVLNMTSLRGSVRRRYGFDAPDAPRASGTLADGPPDFARFWSNSATIAMGPGRPLRMGQDSLFSLKARHLPGSLMLKTEPLVIRVSVLRYPGSIDTLHWRHEESTRQNLQGVFTEPSGTLSGLDTTRFTHILGPADIYDPQARTLTLHDPADAPSVGEAICITAGAGVGSISEIEAVAGSVITLRHPFANAPTQGSTLAVGPWEYAKIEYTAAPTAFDYRGPELTAGDGEGYSVCVLGWSCWRPDVDGWIFGILGWGANGFGNQMQTGAANLITRMIEHFDADMVILHQSFNQGFTVQQAQDAAAQVVAAGARPLYLVDMVHSLAASNQSVQYANFVLSQTDFPGASPAADSRIGSFLQRRAGAQSEDTHHPSIEGMLSHAKASLALFSEFPTEIPGDINGDGCVDHADLAALLSAYGTVPGHPNWNPDADLTGDDAVGHSDLALLLGNWGEGC